MPRRKRGAPPPQFTFVTLQSNPDDDGQPVLSSKAIRSHAAYWSGRENRAWQHVGRISTVERNEHLSTSADRSRESMKQAHASPHPCPEEDVQPDLELVSVAHTAPCAPAWTQSTVTETAGARTLTHAQLVLQAQHTMARFFGLHFMKAFIVPVAADSDVLSRGCLLLSLAYSMATTGTGNTADLLALKANVLSTVVARVQLGWARLGAHLIGGMLMLGAPIVCLLSQSLPDELTVSRYIAKSSLDSTLCCVSAADTAQNALHERLVHWRKVRELMRGLTEKDIAPSHARLMRYISNYMSLSLLLDATGWLDVPEPELPPSTSLGQPSPPDLVYCGWISPLTPQWKNRSAAGVSNPLVDLLGSHTHEWLLTFLDTDGRGLVPSIPVLAERERCRATLELFLQQAQPLNQPDAAMYGACHWAASVLLRVDEAHSTIASAALQVQIEPRLVSLLRMTDLNNLWGEYRGYLFWVTSVCHIATQKQCFPLLTTALTARFVHDMALSADFQNIGMKPLTMLKTFEKICSISWQDSLP